MLFTSAPSTKEKKRILLSCQIALDQWTGEAHLQPEINVDGIPIEKEVKKLFRELLDDRKFINPKVDKDEGNKGRPDAVMRAMCGALTLFFEDN